MFYASYELHMAAAGCQNSVLWEEAATAVAPNRVVEAGIIFRCDGVYKNQHIDLYDVLTYVFHIYLLVHNTYIKYFVQTLGTAAAEACPTAVKTSYRTARVRVLLNSWRAYCDWDARL